MNQEVEIRGGEWLANGIWRLRWDFVILWHDSYEFLQKCDSSGSEELRKLA